MRSYPTDSYEEEQLNELNPKAWMKDALKMNPSYPHWGNNEDYMADGSGWSAPCELKSVDELWTLDELNELVNFYFEVVRDSHKCEKCEGSGYNRETYQLSEDWYDFSRTGKRWYDKLTQDEVDELWDRGRLKCDFKMKPTAEEVNAAARSRSIHDAINRFICIEKRAKRLGIFGECSICSGKGYYFDEEEAHLELQLWFIHPRKGCSRGVRVMNVTEDDMPKVIDYLKEARRRNEERFSGIDSY